MAGPLKNTRHERFALSVAGGMHAGPAYAKAGFKAKGRISTDPRGSKLARNDKVKARIAELQGIAAQKAEVTVDSLCKELDEAASIAKTNQEPSGMVAAIMGKARITGHYVGERVNMKTPLSDMSKDELAAELARLRKVNDKDARR